MVRLRRQFLLRSRRPGGSLPPPWSPASLSLCSVGGRVGLHREIDLAGLPIFAGFTEDRADES